MTDLLVIPEARLKDRARSFLQPANILTKEQLAYERALASTKWFDYRFISPVTATQLFAEACNEIYRGTWARSWTSEQAASKEALHFAGVKFSTWEFTNLWEARQFADLLGMPYDFFARNANKIRGRRNQNQLARPGEPYSRFHRRMLDKWTEYRRQVRIMVSALPQYRNEAFCGLPAQIAHREWVLGQIELRGAAPYLIGRFVFTQRLVPLEMAIARFGRDAVDRAKRDAEDETPVERTDLADSSLWPACFTVAHAVELTSTHCSSCPVATRCAAGERVVRNALVHLHGSDDPVGERHRAAAAERRARGHRKKAA